MPLVSIVVPVHNTAPYLEECVNSLLAQTIADRIEIILVENASTDDSPAICRALAASHPATIRLLTLDRGDVSLARNEGVKAATGKYIGFVDSDDTVAPDMYEQLVNAKENLKAESSYCNFKWVTEQAEDDWFHSSGLTSLVSGEKALFDIITEKGTSSPCVRLFDREFLLYHTFPTSTRWEDHRCIYRWIGEQKSLAWVDSPLYNYFSHPVSYTQGSDKDAAKSLDFILAESERLPYIKQYPWTQPGLKKRSLSACVNNLFKIMVRYIGNAENLTSEDPSILKMRAAILATTRHIMPWQISLFQWLQLQRLRFGWTQFVKHQVHRANGK